MSFIIDVSLFIAVIFPIILSLTGLEWQSSDESPLYTIVVLGVNAIIICYIIIYEMFNHKKANGPIFPYFIPVLIGLIYMAECAIHPLEIGALAQRSFTFFYAFSMGAICAATYCVRYNKLPPIVKNLELLMLICSIALILALPALARSTSRVVNIGGGNHQAISYTAALAFGVIYCSLQRHTAFERYRIFNLSYNPPIAILILVLLTIVCIIGGGRGGSVLLIVNLLVCTYILSKKNLWKISLGIVGVAIALLILSSLSIDGIDRLIENGFERSFAFIGDKGIDLENGSSGRDRVYLNAVSLFLDRPLLGYGIFGEYIVCQNTIHQPYPHNVFLEALLQLGIVGFVILCVVLLKFFQKLSKLVGRGGYYIYLIPIATFALVMLQFSGTYIFCPSFWFILIVAFAYKSRAILSIITDKNP